MTVRLRFAPSPTGFLHIGGARTALFNYLYAKHHNGSFLLRIEDTDKSRSTKEAIDAILEGLEWLGLPADETPIMQSANEARHADIAHQLLETGHAYRCYATQEELAELRTQAQSENRAFRYDGRWRDREAADAPKDVPYAVRLKAPQTGKITINDAVQGEVSMDCQELDDMILLRSDGTPTYLLAVVVDDHDMGITHILRGDDHFTNSFRQAMIYNALGWTLPITAHVPLIHGTDGAKLSKRHGALGVEAYRDMGYLPEALRNYLLRLGWSHGDDEIISDEQAIAWFSAEGLGKSPSRFDFDKLNHINAHYIREAKDARIVSLVQPFVCSLLKRELSEREEGIFAKAVPSLKERAATLLELAESSLFYFELPEHFSDKATKLIKNNEDVLLGATKHLHSLKDWTHDSIMGHCQLFAESQELKLGKVMQPIRAAITGSHASPSMFEVMEFLGKEESLRRLELAH